MKCEMGILIPVIRYLSYLIVVSRVKDPHLRPLLNFFVRSSVIDGAFTTDENELKTKSFPKTFIDFIRQGDVLTFRQSLLIDADAFIYTSDFKMHHFTLFFSNGGNRKMTVFKGPVYMEGG